MIEFVGIIATILVAISMCFKTQTYKGALIMRIVNTVGSIVFVAYGFMLPAYSTAVLNILLAVINIYHIFLLVKNKNTDSSC